MKIVELLELRSRPEQNLKVSINQQIQEIIKKHGGTIDNYWVSSTGANRLGFYGGDSTFSKPELTRPGKALVVPTEPFKSQMKYHSSEFATYGGAEYSGSGTAQEKYGLWFMPLKYALPQINKNAYEYQRKYLWLVKLNDDAWLQPVNTLQRIRANIIGIKPPAGKRKVGQYNPDSKIAVLFEPAYKIVGKWTSTEIKNNARREQIGNVWAQQPAKQKQ